MGITGEVRFVSDFDRSKRELFGEGALIVEVKRTHRGRLAESIDDAIETALAARGASAPGVGVGDMLADQTYRARHLGYEGIGVCVECLTDAAGPIGALDGVDATNLVTLARATKERPIVLVLRERDTDLRAYAETVSLPELLEERGGGAEGQRGEEESADDSEEEARPMSEAVLEALGGETPVPANGEVDEQAREDEDDGVLDVAGAEERPMVTPEPERVLETALAAVATLPAPPEPTFDEGVWRVWTSALAAARGPQTLAAFERLFGESYLPLANMVARGLRDPRAIAAVEEFRRTFARSYADACPVFPLTSKRPRMTLDAFDVAGRLARAHGARASHLLMACGMRWDIGQHVREALTTALAGRGSLVAETSLFSLLPTYTMRQLEGLARGVEALRSPAEPREDDPVRGRTAEVVRRVKVGARDVYKLDWVDAAVRACTGSVADDLPGIASECADIIARHAATLPPRTLLFVFGDRGFAVDAAGRTSCGGASPEEVIVPAFAILVGDLH